MLDLRPEVAAFAQLMERQLRANDHKRGWQGDGISALYWRLIEESQELQVALVVRAPSDVVGREAADVANFAMMIADVAGALTVDLRDDE